jgi:DNA-binding NtrC family response regulator
MKHMPEETIRILTVDDDPNVCWTIKEKFSGSLYHVESAHDGESALELARTTPPHFVLLDLKIPGTDGLEILSRLKEMNKEVAVIVVSGFTDPKNVVEALRLGAEDFIAKPFDPQIIEIAMKNILEKRNLQDQVSRLKSELDRDHAFGVLVGESPQMVEVRDLIKQVANTDLNILIRGESGTGKDVTARLIHQVSKHKDGPFVKVNCAALPENLIEAELFGYEKGAFTGAVRAKPGRFQLAHGGTIFLDEITEIPFMLQSKLLQVLEQREFVRVGGTRTVKVDCRCIAATNANMDLEMEQKGFREDLFFRLNEFTIRLPPLRERRDDVPLLINYFLNLYSERYQRQRKPVMPASVELMMHYPWPGNVRELESLLKRMMVLDSEDIIAQTIGDQGFDRGESLIPDRTGSRSRGPAIRETTFSEGTGFQRWKPDSSQATQSVGSEVSTPELPETERGPKDGMALEGVSLKSIVERAVEDAERNAILGVLNRTRWNRRKAAKELGISYSSLLRRISKYELASR